ncbi:MAG: hypothetical protein ABSC06_35285 [Rhodopila sp.]
MFDRVQSPIDPGPFAVPRGEDAFKDGIRQQSDLLRSANRGGRKVFIHPGFETDICGFKPWADRPQRHVDTAQWGAAIARDIARRVPACGAIERRPRQKDAGDRLHAIHQHWAIGVVPLVVKRDLLTVHAAFNCQGSVRSFVWHADCIADT